MPLGDDDVLPRPSGEFDGWGAYFRRKWQMHCDAGREASSRFWALADVWLGLIWEEVVIPAA